MTETATRSRAAVATTIGVLAAGEAATFFIGALAHLGMRIPLGFATIAEPQIIGATIVEGLCGLFLAVGAYAVFARQPWAWPTAIAAHAFGLGGVLLGMAAIAAGAGPRTSLNDIYHRVILVALLAGTILLLTPIAKAALGRGAGSSRRR